MAAMRRLLIGVLALIGVAAIAVTGGWYWAGERLRSGLATWAEQARAQGWQVSAGPGRLGGWPLTATLALPDVRLAGTPAALPLPLRWQADRVVLLLSLLHPRTLLIQAEGARCFGQVFHLGAAPHPMAPGEA